MKSKSYKYILICGALLCNGVASLSTAHANSTDGLVRAEEKNIIEEKETLNTLTVNLTWQDLEKTDHSKDTVRVQLYKNGAPYGGSIRLNNSNWNCTWDFSSEPGWEHNEWDVKVVENKQGYKPEIRFNSETHTFEITNKQEKENLNTLAVNLTWQDSEVTDHSKDIVKVQLYKNGAPYGGSIRLNNNNWNCTWDFSSEPGWENHDWDVKVVENKQGYKPEIRFNNETHTFEIANKQEEETLNTLAVNLTWQDLEKTDHSKDAVRVQLYRNGDPYGGSIRLNNSNWNCTWDFSSEPGWENHDWDVKVVENKQGYKPEIRFNNETHTFEITNKQEEEKENLNTLAVNLTWQDLEKTDHSKDAVRVQLYRNGDPYGGSIRLNNSNWNCTWDFSSEPGWENHDWDVKVVENKQGYELKIEFNSETRTFEVTMNKLN